MVPVSINLINNLFGHPPNTSAEVAPRERRKEKKGGQNRNYFDLIAKSTDVSSRTFCRASLSLSFSTVLHSGYAFDDAPRRFAQRQESYFSHSSRECVSVCASVFAPPLSSALHVSRPWESFGKVTQ